MKKYVKRCYGCQMYDICTPRLKIMKKHNGPSKLLRNTRRMRDIALACPSFVKDDLSDLFKDIIKRGNPFKG